MVEAPLLVRPYLKESTRGELFILMSCGMATIAGTVMVLYASILIDVVPDAMGHLLAASVINAPGAILIGALMVPPGKENTEARLVLAQQHGCYHEWNPARDSARAQYRGDANRSNRFSEPRKPSLDTVPAYRR